MAVGLHSAISAGLFLGWAVITPSTMMSGDGFVQAPGALTVGLT